MARELAVGLDACRPLLAWRKRGSPIHKISDESSARCLKAIGHFDELAANARLKKGAVSASLLRCAAGMGASEAREALIKKGAQMELSAKFGAAKTETLTALGVAIRLGFDETGEALARAGADPMARLDMDAGQASAGWVAVYKGLERTVRASAPKLSLKKSGENEKA